MTKLDLNTKMLSKKILRVREMLVFIGVQNQNKPKICTSGFILLPDFYIILLLSLGTMFALFKNLWCSFLQFSYTVHTNRYYDL